MFIQRIFSNTPLIEYSIWNHFDLDHSGPSLLRSVVFIGAEFAIINTRLVYTGEVQPAGSLHTDRFYRQPGPGSRPELSLQSGE